MDSNLKNLKGSEHRDLFKQKHKLHVVNHYACDIDFALVEYDPPGIAAFFDAKRPGQKITSSEIIVYNRLMRVAPIYIVYCDLPCEGPFEIKAYVSGSTDPLWPMLEPTIVVANWIEFHRWEATIRGNYRTTAIERD